MHILNRSRVPVIEGLVEASGVSEPGERASDARSERERVGAGERTAGEISTHMPYMLVTAAVSHLERSGFNVVLLTSSKDMSVTPVVQDVAKLATSPLATNVSNPARSRFVYVTPPSRNVAPTATPGHFTVTPLASNE